MKKTAILNEYEPNKRDSKSMKQKPKELKEAKPTTRVEDFNTPLLVIDRKKQRTSEDIQVLNNVISQVDLIDSLEYFIPEQSNAYSFQNSRTHVFPHGLVIKTDA